MAINMERHNKGITTGNVLLYLETKEEVLKQEIQHILADVKHKRAELEIIKELRERI